ncbi:hypothetical protein Y017_00590 [Alcanivorax sp. 97CO-5]|jgi:hypothetical protein|uniref:hypothetical protein n=1 Tax=unclassified Alcanivorax TaxID=2638842 RepID=UPI0003E7D988|nr:MULTISPECIES: hypothetical protein [unclassified Alcanivorax]EUC71301.1 hypothetical protein Y017_00590 [Alcanivorax sp. 97CO-5]PKG02732.1 hypothetical protein Y019_00600 [Alcanivorax sp. 97CO-6]
MSDARFHIVFSGKLVGGADLSTVKSNLARLFKMDNARVERLFSAQPVVIKKNTDQATAMKFRALMKQAGAECEIRPVAVQSAPELAAAPVPSSGMPATSVESYRSAGEARIPSAGSGGLETVGTIRTGGTGFSGAFSVADVGENLNNAEHAPPPAAPDVSHLSMAPPGERLGQPTGVAPPAQPDIRHLSLKDNE